jgi:hypothetical protein
MYFGQLIILYILIIFKKLWQLWYGRASGFFLHFGIIFGGHWPWPFMVSVDWWQFLNSRLTSLSRKVEQNKFLMIGFRIGFYRQEIVFKKLQEQIITASSSVYLHFLTSILMSIGMTISRSCWLSSIGSRRTDFFISTAD